MLEKVQGIVAICGSMAQAWDQMQMSRISFERSGYIVLLPTDPESSKIFSKDPIMSKRLLKDMHLVRIKLASEVYICNVGGYIGESTREEIGLATSLGKPVYYAYPQSTTLQGGRDECV